MFLHRVVLRAATARACVGRSNCLRFESVNVTTTTHGTEPGDNSTADTNVRVEAKSWQRHFLVAARSAVQRNSNAVTENDDDDDDDDYDMVSTDPQNTWPHERQWCLRRVKVNFSLQLMHAIASSSGVLRANRSKKTSTRERDKALGSVYVLANVRFRRATACPISKWCSLFFVCV